MRVSHFLSAGQPLCIAVKQMQIAGQGAVEQQAVYWVGGKIQAFQASRRASRRVFLDGSVALFTGFQNVFLVFLDCAFTN